MRRTIPQTKVFLQGLDVSLLHHQPAESVSKIQLVQSGAHGKQCSKNLLLLLL